MKSFLITIVGIAVGMVLAFVLVIGVEGFSSVVHPLPAEFKGTMDEMCQHVARYPHWVLGVVSGRVGRDEDRSNRVRKRGCSAVDCSCGVQCGHAAVSGLVQSRNARCHAGSLQTWDPSGSPCDIDGVESLLIC